MSAVLNPWSFTYIRKLVDEATYMAKFHDLRPTMGDEAIMNYKTSHRFNIPFLGDHVPAGWERMDEIAPLIVDITGGKQVNQPAITQFDFYRRISDHRKDLTHIGYGVIERGQVHALVATYQRKESNATIKET